MNKKWLCEIYAINNITKELETFIRDSRKTHIPLG